MADFPSKIWDGCTQTRPDLDTTKDPDYTDWMAVVRELQATQEFVLRTVGNIKEMPDLENKLKVSDRQLAELTSQIHRVRPPEHLLPRLKEIEKKLGELLDSGEIDKNHRKVAALQKQVFALVREVRREARATKTEHETFRNEIRNRLEALDREMQQKLKIVSDRLAEISELLSFEGLEE